MWTRKLTVIGGETNPDDWMVYRGRQEVGRIHKSQTEPGGHDWGWATNTRPFFQGSGYTLDQCLHDMREAIRARWPDDLPEVPRSGTKHGDL